MNSTSARNQIRETAMPAASALAADLGGVYFHDTFEMPLASDARDASGLYLDVVAHTPGWINRLLRMRNAAVALLGLKDVGLIGALRPNDPGHVYRVGDRLDIFTIQSVEKNELIVGENDSHLDVRVSVLKYVDQGQRKLALTTVVKVHNRLGRAYMLLVTPFHKRVVRALLASYAAAAPQAD